MIDPRRIPLIPGLLVAAVVASSGTFAWSQQRVWTDVTGEYEVTAELLRREGDVVVLRQASGKLLRVPIDRLSPEDRAIVKDTAAGAPPMRTASPSRPGDKPGGEPGGEPSRGEAPPADGGSPEPGDDVATSIREAAKGFLEGLRDPDRAAARGLLTMEAGKLNDGPDAPLAKLPTPDPGRRSILIGRPQTAQGMADIPVRVRAGNTLHQTRLHLRLEEEQWKIFAISASYPDGEKSIDFEAEPAPATGRPSLDALVGQPMPLAGYTVAGLPLDMSRYAGKVVLVDFWATWCGPCRQELPNILANWKKYNPQGFDVIAISLDRDLETLGQFALENALPWTVVADKDPRNRTEMAAHYGIRAIPSMFLIGRDGRVAAANVRGARLERELDRLLGEQP